MIHRRRARPRSAEYFIERRGIRKRPQFAACFDVVRRDRFFIAPLFDSIGSSFADRERRVPQADRLLPQTRQASRGPRDVDGRLRIFAGAIRAPEIGPIGGLQHPHRRSRFQRFLYGHRSRRRLGPLRRAALLDPCVVAGAVLNRRVRHVAAPIEAEAVEVQREHQPEEG